MMMTTTKLLNVALLLLCASLSQSAAQSAWPIKHVVVLMLENRSFDHMLGWLRGVDSRVDGLRGDEWCPVNTTDPDSEKVVVDFAAPYVDPDPGHSVPDTTAQIFGSDSAPRVDPPPMNGFVQSLNSKRPGHGPQAMSCFNATSVPIIATLAQEFAVFDQWHASVPGPTEVNRMYVHSATSHGASKNDNSKILAGYPQKPFYDSLSESNVTWRVYYEEISTALVLSQMRTKENLERMKTFKQFWSDVEQGELPTYSFVEPRYYPFLGAAANDQHPSHSVAEGEALIKQIYEALRAAPTWNETLFVITYDEHGGFYDHVPTQLKGVPNPDGINATSPDPPFSFDRIGVRIPTVMVSPWINKGTVVHKPDGPTPMSLFEHSSIPATLKKMLGLPSFLTKRDAWAGTFESVVQQRSSPRTDCPATLPPAPGADDEQHAREMQAPLTDLQRSMLSLAASLHGLDDPSDSVPHQLAGGQLCKKFTDAFIQGFNL